jgi:hypothetical protein
LGTEIGATTRCSGRCVNGAGGSFLNGPASGTGPAQARTSSCGADGIDCGALAISVKGAEGLTTELVSSADGCGMILSMPELDVQPAKAVQARAIADTTEKRMIPVHKTQALYSQTKTGCRNAINQHPQRSSRAIC